MSAAARQSGETLRGKYARVFGVDIALVEVREDDDHARVWCPSRPELPVWTTGELLRTPMVRVRSRSRGARP